MRWVRHKVAQYLVEKVAFPSLRTAQFLAPEMLKMNIQKTYHPKEER